jgi:hypothetical protein
LKFHFRVQIRTRIQTIVSTVFGLLDFIIPFCFGSGSNSGSVMHVSSGSAKAKSLGSNRIQLHFWFHILNAFFFFPIISQNKCTIFFSLTHKCSRVPKGTCIAFFTRCVYNVVAPLPVVRFLFCFFCLTDDIHGYLHNSWLVIWLRQLEITSVCCEGFSKMCDSSDVRGRNVMKR